MELQRSQPQEERRNLLLTLRYQGTRYHGFQVQSNAVTVSQVFQQALEQVLGRREEIKGCSRTDSGVHANRFCVSVRTGCRIPCNNLVLALNTRLPHDIAVLDCREVPWEFHARYSCLGKRYLYQIHNSPVKDPFAYGLVCHHRYPLEVERLDRECRDFVGTHDFSAFCAAGSGVENRVRTIRRCGMSRQGERVTFLVEGDGFLYNMVRIMVGTLLDISAGGIAWGSIPEILRSRDRSRAGATAPACGLYLDQVFYPPRLEAAPAQERKEQ